MKVKSIGANKTELELKDVLILISYETPVAAIGLNKPSIGALKTSEYFSNTTSKHINMWLRERGFNPDKVGTMNQAWFNELLEDNTPK